MQQSQESQNPSQSPPPSFRTRIWTWMKTDFSLNIHPRHFHCSEWELSHSDAQLQQNQNQSQSPAISHSSESQSHPQLSPLGGATPTFPPVSLCYLIYRFLFMLFLLSSLTFSTSCQSYLFHIFLTNWSFSLQTLYGTLFFLAVLQRYRKSGGRRRPESGSQSQEKQVILEMNGNGNFRVPAEGKVPETEAESRSTSSLTRLEKLVWILMNIVHVLPYIVVFGYWTVVYKHNPDQPLCERLKSHYIVHSAVALLAFVDTMVIAVPARLTHFLIPTGLVCIYMAFTYIYELFGGPYREGKSYIYSVLNWKEGPGKAALYSSLAVLLIPLAHLIFCWTLYKLRVSFKALYFSKLKGIWVRRRKELSFRALRT